MLCKSRALPTSFHSSQSRRLRTLTVSEALSTFQKRSPSTGGSPYLPFWVASNITFWSHKLDGVRGGHLAKVTFRAKLGRDSGIVSMRPADKNLHRAELARALSFCASPGCQLTDWRESNFSTCIYTVWVRQERCFT